MRVREVMKCDGNALASPSRVARERMLADISRRVLDEGEAIKRGQSLEFIAGQNVENLANLLNALASPSRAARERILADISRRVLDEGEAIKRGQSLEFITGQNQCGLYRTANGNAGPRRRNGTSKLGR